MSLQRNIAAEYDFFNGLLEDGTEREDNFTAGETIWAPAETHRGTATTDLELILIELKRSAG